MRREERAVTEQQELVQKRRHLFLVSRVDCALTLIAGTPMC
jgi:hypothetical protein